jgi:2-oxoglutarate ferredoxin oxidoreductase subunit alpha
MRDISILIGGKAGEGINQAGAVIGRIFNRLGYRLYIYFDYPSLIRGGHNFSIIRAAGKKISVHKDKIDFLLALNQDAIDLHKERLKKDTLVIYDSDSVKAEGVGLPLSRIIKEKKAPPIMRNSAIIGAFCKIVDIEWNILEKAFRKNISKNIDLNLSVAREAYDKAEKLVETKSLSQSPLPIFTGNEVVGLGLIKGGLKTYVAYPMTPASSILHFLAAKSDDFDLKVIHPENEIAVILMALGAVYAGDKTAVGTSGGGFCLMTEGLSLAGMAELPVVVVVSQRPGPSTGVPTYTSQADLNFVLNAGHGEFPRLVVSPGDAEQSYFWSAVALNLSWKFKIFSVILVDKSLSEGSFSFDMDSAGLSLSAAPEDPCSFFQKDKVVKVNSYEHDEFGITTEDASQIKRMQDKRLGKEKSLIKELEKNYKTVRIYGDKDASTALLCWGSNKGVCVEVAEKLGVKVIQPLVLSPFPIEQFQKAVKGVKKLISVENNATGQMAALVGRYGFKVDEKILKYDGRPFSLEELERKA